MTPWTLQRRQFVAGAAALATAALGGCDHAVPPLEGGFTGIDMARGHATVSYTHLTLPTICSV